MPRDAVSRTANVGTVGKNGLINRAWCTGLSGWNLFDWLSERLMPLSIMGGQLRVSLEPLGTMFAAMYKGFQELLQLNSIMPKVAGLYTEHFFQNLVNLNQI